MTLVPLSSGGLMFPHMQREATGNFQINASGEVASLVFRVPKTGNVTRFEAQTTIVANAPDNGQRFSFQDVSLTTGLPDGTPDQFATIASGSVATGWTNPGDFSASRAVTKGDLLAAVVDIGGAFVAGDNFSMGTADWASIITGFPYSTFAGNLKNTADLLLIALRYDDGTYEFIGPDIWPGITAGVDIDTGTTPDEFGLAFTLPFAATIDGIFAQLDVATGGDFTVKLYNAADGLLASKTMDGNVNSGNDLVYYFIQFDTPTDLIAGDLYRVTILPTTTTNVIISDVTVTSLAHLRAIEGGVDLYSTQRTNAGAWTNFNSGTFRRPRIALYLTQFDSGGSGGGEHASVF